MTTAVLVLDEHRPFPEDHIATVYRYAVREGGIAGVELAAGALGLCPEVVRRAVHHLVESRLLRVEGAGGQHLVPVDPEVAAALLVSPMEREIHQRRELIAQIRQRTDVFRAEYAQGGASGFGASSVEQVVGSSEVRGYLDVAAEGCRGEVMVLLSGRHSAEELDDFQQVVATLVQRGVITRIVCQHRSRADLTVRTKIKQLAAAGAEVRTVSHVPRTAVVFDRALALLLGTDDEGTTTGSRVRNGGVASFLLDVFDHLWDVATPLDSFESGYAEVTGDLQQTIAGLMAKGFTDEVLARKLGMSVRTCRRHIAALMRDLDAVSRFQAGVQAARRSLINGAEAAG